MTRPLGRTELQVSPIGFGAFKIGRNQGIKYAAGYPLPEPDEVDALLNGLLDLGISYIDTAPAYGCSEERIGRFLAGRRDQFVLSTKVGETFIDQQSQYDFTGASIRSSVDRSRMRLRSEMIDVLFIHSDGRDLEILEQGDAVETVLDLRDRGVVRAAGFSAKTRAGAEAALAWADVIMVEYHLDNRELEPVIQAAGAAGVGVVVKKGLASGHLDPAASIRLVLANPAVSSLVIGSLSLDHLRENLEVAEQIGDP